MIFRGCVYSKIIQIKLRSTGLPPDISLWQFEANLKDQDGAIVLAMSNGGGHFVILDGPNAKLQIAMTVAETQALSAGPVSARLYRTDVDRTASFIFSEQVRDQD